MHYRKNLNLSFGEIEMGHPTSTLKKELAVLYELRDWERNHYNKALINLRERSISLCSINDKIIEILEKLKRK